MAPPPHTVPGRNLPVEQMINRNLHRRFNYARNAQRMYRGDGTWGGPVRQRILFQDDTRDLFYIHQHFNRQAQNTRFFLGGTRARFLVHDRWLAATDPTDLRQSTLLPEWFTDASTARKRILTQIKDKKLFRRTG